MPKKRQHTAEKEQKDSKKSKVEEISMPIASQGKFYIRTSGYSYSPWRKGVFFPQVRFLYFSNGISKFAKFVTNFIEYYSDSLHRYKKILLGVNTFSAASNLALAILLILPSLPLALQALLIHVFINVIQEVMTDYAQEVIQETKPWWSHC